MSKKPLNFDFKNKSANIIEQNQYMLTKTLSMFEWEGLPETIPPEELEKMLQVHGYAFIAKHNGKSYAFTGGLGGEPDVYGNPTEIVISNPALKITQTFKLSDGILIKNDDLKLGLMPLFNRANTLLIENDVNMVLHGYNSRLQVLISAPDDTTKQNADAYLKKVIDGEIGIIGENAMFDGLRTHNTQTAQGTALQNMIEYHQYLKGSLYNEVGLSANFNMKRERLNSSEVGLSEDSLFPLVYSMMKNRLSLIDKLSEFLGSKIDVDFGSVWALKNKELVDNVLNNEEHTETTDPLSDVQKPTDEPPHEPTDEPPREPTDEPTDAPPADTPPADATMTDEEIKNWGVENLGLVYDEISDDDLLSILEIYEEQKENEND